MLVLLHHAEPGPPPYAFGIGRALRALCGGAWCGVNLFFVLSGFLVSGLLFREDQVLGRVSFGRFFVRRGLRIYPAFYVMLALFGPFEAWWTHRTQPELFLHEALFIQNYTRPLFIHTWSLAIEEHFYLLVGLAVAALAARKAVDVLSWVCFASVPVCLALRWSEFVPGSKHCLYPTHLRLDSLAVGVLVSYFFHYHRDAFLRVTRHRLALLAVAAVCVTPTFFVTLAESEYVQTLGFTLNAVGFAALVSIAAVVPPAMVNGPVGRLMAWCGLFSYSVYLWHVLAMRLMTVARRSGMSLPWPVQLAIFVALSFGLGIGMAKLVEVPVLRLRDRYWPRRAAGD